MDESRPINLVENGSELDLLYRAVMAKKTFRGILADWFEEHGHDETADLLRQAQSRWDIMTVMEKYQGYLEAYFSATQAAEQWSIPFVKLDGSEVDATMVLVRPRDQLPRSLAHVGRVFLRDLHPFEQMYLPDRGALFDGLKKVSGSR